MLGYWLVSRSVPGDWALNCRLQANALIDFGFWSAIGSVTINAPVFTDFHWIIFHLDRGEEWAIVNPLRQSPSLSHAQPQICYSIEPRASAIASHRPGIGRPFPQLNNRRLRARTNSQRLRGSVSLA